MQTLISELLEKGYEVTIITVKCPKPLVINVDVSEKVSQKIEKVTAAISKKALKQAVDRKINWKTIAKIKDAKDDGLTSQECADELNLSIATVNKYWVR